MFAYTITIENTGTVAAQLISRHWIITDAENNIQEVSGLGVVGEQPLLRPGESFEYTSGTSMATPVGTHARHLPDGGGRRQQVRSRDSPVHPVDAQGIALSKQ